VDRVCEELQRILPLVSAIAGPGVSIELKHCAQDWPLPLSSEDLTRVMANLVRNASEAMAGSGRIQIAVEETAGFVVLSVADEGPGIPRELMERVFQAGFSSRESHAQSAANGKAFEPAPSPAWPVRHRGLGLSIVRSIVSAARGTVWAANRSAAPAAAELPAGNLAAQDSHGAMFFLEFPLPRKGCPD
jgi:signal transduction histidine kinase